MTTSVNIKNRFRFISALTLSLASCLLANSARAASMDAGSRSITLLCPTHIGGDKEFNGNGPNVSQYVGLKKSNSGQSVQLDLYATWKETKSNWTEARLDRDLPLANSPNQAPFTKIWARGANGVYSWQNWTTQYFDAYSEQWVDTDHAYDSFYPSTLPDPGPSKVWWLEEVRMKGDTKGNDVGSCTTDAAHMNLYLPAIWVWY